MIADQILKITGGLGLFIYSLRLITNAIDETTSHDIRKLVEKLTSKSYICVFVGIGLTALLQASSATILICMSLLNRSLITLQQAALIMLGATVGTTFKIWHHQHLSPVAGACLIAIASIGILLSWKKTRFQILEISLGIGFTTLGLNLTSSVLESSLESPAFLNLFASCRGDTFVSASIAMICGALASVLVQSSSSIILLTIGLASKGLISFEGASAVLLGANVGTTSTALLVSMGQSISAKRLAFMHFAAKAIGVLLALIFFRLFLTLILLLIPLRLGNEFISIRLAAVHTGFNSMNLIFWWTFLPLLQRISRVVLPDAYDSEYWLSSLGVQKLLARLPDRALQEAQVELQRIVRGLSEITRDALSLLLDSNLNGDVREKLLKDATVNLANWERRLKNVEAVMGRVASRWGETHHLQPRLFCILEKIFKLGRIMIVLEEFVGVLDLRSIISEMSTNQELRRSIELVSKDIQERWDHLYRTLPGNQEPSTDIHAYSEGAFIFKQFFKGQDFRNGIKLQQHYGILYALYKVLAETELYPQTENHHRSSHPTNPPKPALTTELQGLL